MNIYEIREGLHPTRITNSNTAPAVQLLVTGNSIYEFMCEFVPYTPDSDFNIAVIDRVDGDFAVACLNDYFTNPAQLPEDVAMEYGIREDKLANAIDEILYVFEFMLDGITIDCNEITFIQHRTTCSLLVELT